MAYGRVGLEQAVLLQSAKIDVFYRNMQQERSLSEIVLELVAILQAKNSVITCEVLPNSQAEAKLLF